MNESTGGLPLSDALVARLGCTLLIRFVLQVKDERTNALELVKDDAEAHAFGLREVEKCDQMLGYIRLIRAAIPNEVTP